MHCVCVLQLSLRLMFKTPLVSFYIYEYKGSAKAHIFPNVFFCSSPSCLDQACVPLYTLYCMQSCPSLQNLLHLQSEHTLRVYTSRLYISLYFDLHVCIAASDHEYIVSMHFIKLYKGEGNAPDVSDCCYETTGESVTKKKCFSSNKNYKMIKYYILCKKSHTSSLHFYACVLFFSTFKWLSLWYDSQEERGWIVSGRED